MNDRLSLWLRAATFFGASVIVISAAHSAQAQQRVIIPECEKASLFRTQGKKEEAAKLQKVCDRKFKTAKPPPPRPIPTRVQPDSNHRRPPSKPSYTPAPPSRPPTRRPPYQPPYPQAGYQPPGYSQPAPPPRRPRGNGLAWNVTLPKAFVPSPAPAPAPAPMAAPAPAAPPVALAPAVAPAPIESQPVQEPAVGPPDASLLADQLAAKKDSIDLSVFGVRLGEPMTLPRCTATTARACISSREASGFLVLVARAKAGRATPRVPGNLEVPVQLPASQCPAWLSAGRTNCTAFFTVKDGYVVAAYYPVGGEALQPDVEGALTLKYGRSTANDPASPCPTPSSKIRVWPLSGVRVVYDPLGPQCGKAGDERANLGFVEVWTNTYARLVQQASAQEIAQRPKM